MSEPYIFKSMQAIVSSQFQRDMDFFRPVPGVFTEAIERVRAAMLTDAMVPAELLQESHATTGFSLAARSAQEGLTLADLQATVRRLRRQPPPPTALLPPELLAWIDTRDQMMAPRTLTPLMPELPKRSEPSPLPAPGKAILNYDPATQEVTWS